MLRILVFSFLSLTLLSAVHAGDARANSNDNVVEIAHAGSVLARVTVDFRCDRERATIVFKNLGSRWKERATVSVRHTDTGKAVQRKVLVEELKGFL